MIRYQTLPEMLEHRSRGDGTIGYLEGEGAEKSLRLSELRQRALGILRHLQQAGAQPGDRLILHVPTNEQFLDAYWACVHGGIVPVPVAIGISDEHKYKLLRIAKLLGDPLLYTTRKVRDRLADFAAGAGETAAWAALAARSFVIDELDDVAKAGLPARVQPDDTAFIQFSSGSTSDPKGVVLTHANLLANSDGAMQGAQFSERDTSLGWMPLTHDMGLIGFHLFMLYAGVSQYLMPTDLFVRRAVLWMKFAADKQVTVTCSPNFGYRHFLRALGERPLEADLSRIRIIFNGAEPISVELAEEFLARLAQNGLARAAMLPVYGLAEASLAVTIPTPGIEFRTLAVDRRSLGVGQAMVPVPPTAREALRLMCVGRPIPHTSVRLVDESGVEVTTGTVGHLLIRGANVTREYFRNAEATAAAIGADGWVRTGDLALLHEGEYYITGRSKEIIFVNGQNYYPHDLEAILQKEPGLELGKAVAAGVRSPGASTDELVLFVLHRGAMEDFLPLATRAAHLVNEHAGVEVTKIVPIRRVPKTTSGKLQRTSLAEAYAAGEFDAEIAEYDAARTAAHGPSRAAAGDIERLLKAIVDDVLPGKGIDVDDDLFDVGASSLALIQVHERIEDVFPGLVDLTELFDYPTIAQLAKHVETKLAGRNASG